MNISMFSTGGRVYTNCENICGYSFKAATTWDKSLKISQIANFGLSKDNSIFSCCLNVPLADYHT